MRSALCKKKIRHYENTRIVAANRFDAVNETTAIAALAALAHPVRLKVFRALVVSGLQGLTPGTMTEGLGIPATTLSFHLKELATAGLVQVERASRNLVYRAAYDTMNGLLAYLTENCCQGAGCAPADAARAATADCGC
jgi:ArsR family transcriptional regulator, arsenate/arsenite/antimonite-responsive transcriptional repressor